MFKFNVGDRVRVNVPPHKHADIIEMHDGQVGTVVKNYGMLDVQVRLDAPIPEPFMADEWVASYPQEWLELAKDVHTRFVLQRDEDETGVSGTGVVAEGVEFSDGVVALRWIVPAGAPGAGNPTSVVFHDNGIASVEKIHGHGGKTRIVWIDNE